MFVWSVSVRLEAEAEAQVRGRHAESGHRDRPEEDPAHDLARAPEAFVEALSELFASKDGLVMQMDDKYSEPGDDMSRKE